MSDGVNLYKVLVRVLSLHKEKDSQLENIPAYLRHTNAVLALLELKSIEQTLGSLATIHETSRSRLRS